MSRPALPELESMDTYQASLHQLRGGWFAADSPLIRGLRALASNRMAVVGVVIILIWVAIAITAPILAPYDPLEQDIANRLKPPSAEHFFGTGAGPGQ